MTDHGRLLVFFYIGTARVCGSALTPCFDLEENLISKNLKTEDLTKPFTIFNQLISTGQMHKLTYKKTVEKQDWKQKFK